MIILLSDWLWNMTIGTTVTAAVILIFKKIFKDKLSARIHVLIWVVLLLRLAAPVLPESEISFLNMVPEREIVFQELAAENMPAGSGHESDTAGDAANSRSPVPEGLLAGIWGTGAVLIFGYFTVVSLTFSVHTGRRKQVTDEKIINILTDCKQILGIERNIMVVSGEETPMMTGFAKPKIILRPGYSRSEIRNIFIHELCHLKHGDVPAIWAATAVLCLNWFNPLIWYAFFVFRRDIEVYCDERVLRYLDSKKQYALLLLKTVLGENRFVPGTTCLQSGIKEVERRINYMANFKKPGIVWSLIIVLAVGLIWAGCLTNGVSDAAQADSGSTASAKQITMVLPHDGEVSAGFAENPVTGVKHNAVDFMGQAGDPVVASADGEVAKAEYDTVKGNYVLLVHADGVETLYAHLDEIKVKIGDKIMAGNLVGSLGNTGTSTGSSLHFELLIDGEPVDPQSYF